MRIVPGSWKIPLGKTYWGRPVFLNLNSGPPHTKIAGVTGSGKSECMRSILYYLCNQQSPKNVELHIIDLKGGATFAQFELLPHVFKVYPTTEDALLALSYCAQEMWDRLEEIKKARKAFRKDPWFKRLVVLIDEGGELSPADAIGEEQKLRKACMEVLSQLVRVGREPGIRIIYGTQRPDRTTLPMTIRAQLENTICFRVSEKYDSNIVLGHEGAETLPKIPGRMIYRSPAGEVQLQGVYVPQHVIEAWLRQYADLPYDVEWIVMDEVETKMAKAREYAANKLETAGNSASSMYTDEVIDVWSG